MAVRKAFYSRRSPSLFYAAHQNEVGPVGSGFVSDTTRTGPRSLEMSRVKRGLNKARNPDYFVRIQHSVSEMDDRLQPLSVILRRGQKGDGKGNEEKAGRAK